MHVLSSIILFGFLACVSLLLLPQTRNWRLPVIFIFNVLFLYYAASLTELVALTAWVMIVYAVAYLASNNRLSGKPAVAAYAFVVLAAFIVFKLHAWNGERNALGDFAMPLGFSFVMFQSLAFLIDVSRGHIQGFPRLFPFLTGALFFPTISIGPFYKIQDLLAQFEAEPRRDKSIFGGYCLFALGAFKFGLSGVIQSLTMPLPLDWDPDNLIHPSALVVMASLYLYLNFSGFSDMVVGLSSVMGYDVPYNFRFPFFSYSMAEYWRKWHISLGNLFREYVFYPLAYRWREPHAAIFVTMMLIGLWHGFTWKIAVWAMANAVLVAFSVNQESRRWWQMVFTMICALLINTLFLSNGLAGFWRIVSQIPARGDLFQHSHNFSILVKGALFFPMIWWMEKQVDRVMQDEATAGQTQVNWWLATATIFLGIVFGIGRAHVVYIGY